MRIIKLTLLLIVIQTVSLYGQTVIEIMTKTNEVATESSESTFQKMKLATCT